MKKLIQVSAVLSLVFFFSVAATNAQQVIRQYQAEIPFDFNIGQKSHQAGSYTIKISKLSLNNVSVTLEDEGKNVLQTVFLRGDGNVAKNEAKLVFARYGERRFLSGMRMQEMGLSFCKPKDFERILKAQGRPERQTKDASVALK